MAIATLDKVFNNGDVFTGVVKIRKGLACQLILNANNLTQVKQCFSQFAKSIASRVDPNDPSATKTLELCEKAVKLCEEGEEDGSGGGSSTSMVSSFLRPAAIVGTVVVVVAGVVVALQGRRRALK